MSITVINPIESTKDSLINKVDNDTKLVKNLFYSQLEAMATKMATEFNLPVESLMEAVCAHSSSLDILELIKKNKVKTKSKNKKTTIDSHNQCMARVWGSGDGSDQCKCMRKDGDYCTRHAKQASVCEIPCMLDENGKKKGLFCGRIDQFNKGSNLPPFSFGDEIRIEWNSSEFKEAIDEGIENGIYKRRNVSKTTSKKISKPISKKKIVKQVDLDDEDLAMLVLEDDDMGEDPNDSFDKVIADFGLEPEGDDNADSDYQNIINQIKEPGSLGEEELNVEQWEHNGLDYLVDPNTLIIYNENGEEIGKWGDGETEGATIPKD